MKGPAGHGQAPTCCETWSHWKILTRGMTWPLWSAEEGESGGREISQVATAVSDDGGLDQDGGRAGDEKPLAHKDIFGSGVDRKC